MKKNLQFLILLFCLCCCQAFSQTTDTIKPVNKDDTKTQQQMQKLEDLSKKGKFTKGLVLGITRAGEALKIHFPYQEDDINELPNEISWD